MPAVICHNIHAEHVIEYFSHTDKLSSLNRNAFFWGAQGPDFFFCHRYLPWMPSKGGNLRYLGNEIHSMDPNKLLLIMKNYADKRDDIDVKSYLYGFVCHYAYDSTAHPYIEYFAQAYLKSHPEQTASTMHNEIESALDTILLRKEKAELVTDKKLKLYFPKDKAVMKKIAALWTAVLFEILNKTIPESTIYQAECDAISVFSALTDRTTFKRNFFARLEKGQPRTISSHIRPMMEAYDHDYANVKKVEWMDFGGIKSDLDFFEISEKAKQKATYIIRGMLDNELSQETIHTYTTDRPFG